MAGAIDAEDKRRDEMSLTALGLEPDFRIALATAALTAYESLTGSQEGFVMVPREALAIAEEYYKAPTLSAYTGRQVVSILLDAILTAAPPAPSEDQRRPEYDFAREKIEFNSDQADWISAGLKGHYAVYRGTLHLGNFRTYEEACADGRADGRTLIAEIGGEPLIWNVVVASSSRTYEDGVRDAAAKVRHIGREVQYGIRVLTEDADAIAAAILSLKAAAQ